GSTKGFVVGQYELAKKEVVSATVDYKGTGVYGLSVTGVKPNIEVLYAVWSDTKGQDDLKWYTASSSNNRAAGLINVENHTGLGLYNVHVYQKNNGIMTFLTATTFNVSQDNFTTPYYNQRDPRWASVHYGPYQFGPTGCVPTSLAMVFSSLKNTTVLPTTVGDYLYNETIEFNRGGEGTTGQGILKASQKWGVKANVLNSQDEIISALQEGHHVLAAIQHNKFVIHGTHELVLKGYSNGLTYVRDPYMSSNSGWYPVSALWNEQSTDRGDIEGLGRPFVKITDI
ncbi:MAG: GBS Bsp-like repeat-containing protein, partial [Streptococcus sp.]|nr:GBS Bsp-like repeat-containing protein [Streptococcus sp.]